MPAVAGMGKFCCLTPEGQGQQQAQGVHPEGGRAAGRSVDAVTAVSGSQRVVAGQQQEVA